MDRLLFQINLATSAIQINPQYKECVDNFLCTILSKVSISDGQILEIDCWAYRVNHHIAHTITFSNHDFLYSLTITEGYPFSLSPLSFSSEEGEMFLLDSCDVISFLRYATDFFIFRHITPMLSFGKSYNPLYKSMLDDINKNIVS